MNKQSFLIFLSVPVLLFCFLLTACGIKSPAVTAPVVSTPTVTETASAPETAPIDRPKRQHQLDADYRYGSGMQNLSDSPNDPDGAYYGVGVTQIMFGIRHAGIFTEMVGNLLFNSRDNYTWTLHVASYADKSDTTDYVIEPAARFSTGTATVYQFEPCLAKDAFVPEKDRVYYIDLTIEGSNAVYDIIGSPDGYVLNAQPVGAGTVKDNVTQLSIGPYATDTVKGWENWKAPGENAAQTHLLIRVYGDSHAAYTDADWQITLSGGDTEKTITLIPASLHQSDTAALYRFQPCLGKDENRFIPRKDVDYTISVAIYKNGTLLAESRETVSGFTLLEKAIFSSNVVIDPDNMLDADDTALPIISIITEDGDAVPTDKSEVGCTISLDSKEAQYCAANLSATIRCRGNGSMSVGKSTGKFPYKLKFDQKINLFGLGDGKEKDWVLLAHVGDQSMLRNFAAKYLGDLLDNIPYSPNSMHVNVYLNGEYIGVYELTEQIEVKNNRINIDDSLTDAENGFLVELDAYSSDVYVRVGGQKYTVKSEVYSNEQLDFIKNYLQKVDNAITAGNQKALAELVDMGSLVDMYLIQEFAKNIDAGWSSFYMYREAGGKLIFAPPWDLDLAFGNDNRLDKGSYEGLYIGPGKDGMMQNHRWYNLLYQNAWFRDMIAQRWQEISNNEILQMIQAVRDTAEYILPDMERNYERWDFLGEKQQQEPRAIYELTTYREHIDYLISWMQDRKAWMDKEFSK